MSGIRVPDEFGIIIPDDTDVTYVKQGGGMTPTQRTMEGTYIPLGEGKARLGDPDWYTSAEDVENIDLTTLSEEEQSFIPDYILKRGSFAGHEEYFMWRSQSDQYGYVNLYQDLRRFTYGIFDLLDSDPRDRWDDVDELWEAIDQCFNFTYEEYDYHEREFRASQTGTTPSHPIDTDKYPRPEAAIRWITITGSKTYDGRQQAPWADELEGETVILLCPNAD